MVRHRRDRRGFNRSSGQTPVLGSTAPPRYLLHSHTPAPICSSVIFSPPSSIGSNEVLFLYSTTLSCQKLGHLGCFLFQFDFIYFWGFLCWYLRYLCSFFLCVLALICFTDLRRISGLVGWFLWWIFVGFSVGSVVSIWLCSWICVPISIIEIDLCLNLDVLVDWRGYGCYCTVMMSIFLLVCRVHR